MNLSYYKITQRYKNLQITHNCNKDEIIQYCNFFINCYYQKQKIKTTYNLQIKNSKLENNRFFALCVLLEVLKEKSNISSHTIYKIDSTCEIKNILHNYNEKKCENMFIGLVNMHFFTIDNPQPIVKSQKKSNQAKNILDNHALILALCEIYNIKNPLFFITNSTTNIENLPIKNLQKYKDTYIKIQNMQNENLISYKHSFFFILNYMKCYDILPIALFLMCNAKEKIIKKFFKILRQLMIQRIKIKPLFKKAISQYKIKKLYKKLKKQNNK